jgi:hypothetical protein
MKKYLLFILMLASFLQLRCKSDQREVLFDMVYLLSFDLPAALNTTQTHFVEVYNVQTRWEGILDEFGYTADQIDRIEPFSGFLEVVLLPENLSFMNEVFIEFLDGGNRLECFYTPHVPFNAGNQIQLVGTIADFKRLLMEPVMHFRIGFRLRQPSPSALKYNLQLTFKAKA